MICLTAVARRTAIRAVAAATLLAASVAACSPSSADRTTTGNTVATEAPQTTTTNPYAVPAVIDAAYVNRVLAGLDAVVGDVTRTVVRTKTVPPEDFDRLRAVYGTNELLQLIIDSVQSDLRRGLLGYRLEPGNRVSTVEKILSATPRCVFAQVRRDYQAVSVNPNTVNPQWVGIQPGDANRDPAGYNSTQWSLIYDGFSQDRSMPTNPCAV